MNFWYSESPPRRILYSVQKPHWQHDQRPDQRQRAACSDADQSKRQQQQPDKRIKYQRQKSQRPAQHK
jgi:hypothetical protein